MLEGFPLSTCHPLPQCSACYVFIHSFSYPTCIIMYLNNHSSSVDKRNNKKQSQKEVNSLQEGVSFIVWIWKLLVKEKRKNKQEKKINNVRSGIHQTTSFTLTLTSQGNDWLVFHSQMASSISFSSCMKPSRRYTLKEQQRIIPTINSKQYSHRYYMVQDNMVIILYGKA